MSEIIKDAKSPDQDFESGFFELAYTKLQSKLYNLLPHFVGFELVKKSDDNTKAIGVFAFKSDNGQILYVPAFFINGKVKELDTLYSRNNNQFYPLNEDFAELFLKDDITGLGSVSNDSRKDIMRGTAPVDFRSLALPPRTGRVATASVLDYVAESEDNVKVAMWKIMERSPAFTQALRDYYPDEKIAAALVPTKKIPASKFPEVNVLKFGEALPEDLTDTQRNDLTSIGYTFLDKRASEQKSKFGLVQIPQLFSNPQAPGFYSYLTESGTLRYGLILTRPLSLLNGFSTPDTFVVDLESKKSTASLHISDHPVFIRDQIVVKDYSSVHDMMEDPADALPSFTNDYILINEALECTEIFNVTHNYKEENGVRRLMVQPSTEGRAFSNTAQSFSNRGETKNVSRDIVLVFTKKSGSTLNYKGSTVYIPKGFKLLKVKVMSDYGMCWPSGPNAASNRDTKPGILCHLTAFLQSQQVVPMSLNSNGSDFFLNIAAAKRTYSNPVEAKIAMVTQFGFDGKEAEDLLSTLTPDIAVYGTVKIAGLGDEFMQLVDESPSVNELGQPTYMGIPYEQQASRSDGYTGDPTEPGLGSMPDIKGIDAYVQQAVQMAGNGQKEIFDTQAISTLAKYVDPTSKVTQYIPSFVETLDKLGRMLFMIYWETDKFEKMYGPDELPELLELVKDVFKNLGDLVIFLKRKFPDISINNNEQSKDGI